LTPVPPADLERSLGDITSEVIEGLCIVTKDTFAGPAGNLIHLRDWQRTLNRHAFAIRPDGRLRHRVALIGEPRKNGKSALGSGYALDGLLFGGIGAEVYSCAADKEQARIVFGVTKRIVELSPDLQETITSYRDALEVKETGSIYRCLSSEAFTKEGLNPTRVIFDELHAQPNDELWNVMALATAARVNPLIIAITTAGVITDSLGHDTVCYRLWQHGCAIARGEVEDDSFFMAWWAADSEADPREPATWASANPGYGDLIDPDDFDSACRRTPENEFRTKRLNQWVSSISAWLPLASWTECTAEGVTISEDDRVVLGFDGSYNGDTTALVVVTVPAEDDVPYLDVAGLWEKPVDAGPEWRVPIADVEETIRQCCQRWNVQEIAADPARWARSLDLLEEQGLPVVAFPQSPERMRPATDRFYQAVVSHSLTHSGDKTLASHVGNAVLKTDSRGSRIVKQTKTSSRKIDLAVAAIMALDRAMWWASESQYAHVYDLNQLADDNPDADGIKRSPEGFKILTQADVTCVRWDPANNVGNTPT
jgi:phage terminase large subunit-like protein